MSASEPFAADSPARVREGLTGLDRLLVVYGLCAAIALIYWPSSAALSGFWTDTVDRAYTHGYMVLLTSLWLIAQHRGRLAATPVRASPAALGALLILSAAWLWFWRSAVQDLHLLLLPVLWFVAVAGVLGWRAARVVVFPIGFIYFAMPVWSDLVSVLQNLSVEANTALIWLTGLPAYVAGDIVHVPAGSLEIAGGCSGLHFFVVGLALAALYGELAGDSWRRRLGWLGLMGIVALIANWIRIFVIVVAAYATDMQTYLVRVDHYWFGWGVFAVCFIGFLWLAGHLSQRWDRGEQGRLAPAPEPPAAGSRVSIAAGALVLLCLAALPLLVAGAERLQPPSAGLLQIDWPAAPQGWNGPQADSSSEWSPRFEHASAQSQRAYLDDQGQAVEVLMVAYRTQRQDAKLLAYGNSLLGGEGGARPIDTRIVDSPAGRWRQTTVVDAAGARSLIWSRYRIGRRWFVRPRLAQLWYGIAAMTTPAVSSLTALRAGCRTAACSAARQRLARTCANLQPSLRFAAAPPVARLGAVRRQGETAP